MLSLYSGEAWSFALGCLSVTSHANHAILCCSVEYLHNKMRDYQYTFFYRDCMDGSLRGLLMGSAENKERDGKKYGVITVCPCGRYC